MKKILSLLMLGALAAALSTSALGQAAGPKGGGVQPGGRPGSGQGQRAGAGMKLMQMQREVLAKLDLTKDQKAKIKALDKDTAAKVKALRDKGKAGDRKAMRQEGQAIREEYRKSLMAILTPEQQKKYEQLVREAREKFMKDNAGPGSEKGGKGGK